MEQFLGRFDHVPNAPRFDQVVSYHEIIVAGLMNAEVTLNKEINNLAQCYDELVGSGIVTVVAPYLSELSKFGISLNAATRHLKDIQFNPFIARKVYGQGEVVETFVVLPQGLPEMVKVSPIQVLGNFTRMMSRLKDSFSEYSKREKRLNIYIQHMRNREEAYESELINTFRVDPSDLTPKQRATLNYYPTGLYGLHPGIRYPGR